METNPAQPEIPVQLEDSAPTELTAPTELPVQPETPAPFDSVPECLRAALVRRGFSELTTVQKAAVQASEENRDLRISSQTGSGKTVALGIAMAPELLARLESSASKAPLALVIAPTRELASQVQSELEWLFADVRGLGIDCFTGGTNVGQERWRMARKPRIVVGTPGRLLDHIRSNVLDCSQVSQLVLDEADQMLDLGFRDELEAILAVVPDGARKHMVSATFPAAVRALTQCYQNNPLQVEGTRLGEANADIAHIGHLVQPRERYGALINMLLLAADQRTLIFVATRADTATVAEKLCADGFAAMSLSGDLAQTQRTRTLKAFRDGAVSVLVATDVAARGLDVPDVSMVIHADMPKDSQVYTHRSGRTGRAGQKGRSVMLVTTRAERRARQIFSGAKVNETWQLVPSGVQVKKAIEKRARRQIGKMLREETQPLDERDLDFATRMLEERDPAQVVAQLLRRIRSDVTCEPVDIQTPAPRPGRQRENGRSDRYDRNDRPDRNDRYDRPDRNDRPARNTEQGYTRFAVNYGFSTGANPSRILAMLCRRGNVSSQVIGAIDISADRTTFDVAVQAAPGFESRARGVDKRDPHQRIQRLGAPQLRNAAAAS